MDQRKEFILNIIIKEHIRTGQPVGSELLVEKYKLSISSATVRNIMSELEAEGYILQPYTSAGRIPTEKAYTNYVENIKEKKLGDIEIKILNKTLKSKDEIDFRNTAKVLAKLTNNAVFWAFHRHNLYYTGISNFLGQPEFMQNNLVYNISAIIDRMDEVIDNIYSELESGTQILIGSENPFSNYCGTIINKYKSGSNQGLFGILGPIRMNYEKNLALIKYINKKLNS